MTRAVYLDYNATAPLRPEAAAAVSEAMALTGNASSVHRFGRLARRAVEDSRARIAALVGADPEQLVFTSGGTEANNLALGGTGRPRIIVSAIEHDSILSTAPGAERLPVDEDGIASPDRLQELLSQGEVPALVSVMLANNETGVVQPVAALAAIAHANGALMHCDAVQGAGKLPVAMPSLGVDMLSLSAHKLGGPQGIGALLLAEGMVLQAMQRGGGQERGRRAGTENVAAIAGFAAAVAAAGSAMPAEQARLRALRDRLEDRILRASAGARVFGRDVARLANTSCILMPGVPAETQVMGLDLAGIAVSAGSACSSGKVRSSHVLRAMGITEDAAGSAIRVSLGWQSRDPDVDRLLEAWSTVQARAVALRGASDEIGLRHA